MRIALHTGAAEVREGDYFGPPLNRIARLLEAAHGGQIVLSLAAQELARDTLPERASLKDLGEHRLRDLIRPERVFQLLHPELPADFPPLNTLNSRPNNLPAQPTPLVGREREVAAAGALLRRPEIRLVTLTGPAGTGKTRLGLQVAAAQLDAFADGVYFVPLAPIRDPALVAAPIAVALDLPEAGDRPLPDQIQSYLRDKQILLLLDNFEQVLEAAPLVAALFQAAPRLKVLVTSRAALHLRGEQEFLVPPLALPPLVESRELRAESPAKAGSSDLSTLMQYAAVQLFIQRALAVNPSFAVSNENAAAVAAICHCLDGLPLAIELAAARIKLLSPASILTRLENRLKLLTGGARDLPARQQTLRGAIAWSYDLLDESEKSLFRRLSVCAGGCSLDAAEAICEAIDCEPAVPAARLDPGAGQDGGLLEGIASLVDKSLLRQEESDGSDVRVRILETIREYGLECLEASGEAEATRRRHAHYYGTWAKQADERALEKEHDNVRAALVWLAAHGGVEAAFDLAAAAWIFWYVRGHWSEGRERLSALLVLPGAPPQHRANLLRRSGQLAALQADYRVARPLLEQSLTLYRSLEDTGSVPAVLNALGEIALSQGEYRAARAYFEESMALLRARDDPPNLAWAILSLGEVAQAQGDLEAARLLLTESLALFREVGNPRGIGVALAFLGEAARAQGDLPGARALCEESLAIRRDLGHKAGIARSLAELATVTAVQGDYEKAQALYQECMALWRELGDRRSLVRCLELMAGLARAQDQPSRAARLFGAAEALRETLGAPLRPADAPGQEGHIAAVRAALGETAFATVWAAGRRMSLEQAIAVALGDPPKEAG